tara:strand:- start:506 stop:652 length:147 start_codon:yes stop_codon:yes gene_type:complete
MNVWIDIGMLATIIVSLILLAPYLYQIALDLEALENECINKRLEKNDE